MNKDLIYASMEINSFYSVPSEDRPSGYIHIDDVYRLVAGHNDYHGDSILSAFKCLTEGKDVKPIRPLDRPQGEWIGEADGYADGELIYDTWYCSNCDYVVDDDEPPTWNYCPNCGARMKDTDNETN